ncbi:hypothetical protein [Arthrobacter sp. C9C5]|uniref:hypothetical protein n=1 Tax=Arthrobacter sp. C9C5 TaxID=2735267 RepID=UPI0015853D58|nr:hypothetical protein [Arthrobacter sp. C9C5]NUU30948.1 hypothetical protein [Arthrobacter sp. C9C5]
MEQLRLVHAEVVRQRATVLQRTGNMHTRAAILVTASGVFSTVQANNWVTGWQFISITLSVVAAVIGLWAMRPSSGVDANATLYFQERLAADPYSTEHSIVTDSMEGLSDDLQRIERAAKLIVAGYGILALAWLAMPITVGLMHAKLI